MTTGPSSIAQPTPATGLLVRRPRCEIWIDGKRLYTYLELSSVRGLDQIMATCDFVVPHPLPDWVRYWSRVQIIAGVEPPDPANGQVGMKVRFTGYITSIGTNLWPAGKTVHCDDILVIAANRYTPEERDLGAFLDSAAVREVLFGCGYYETIFRGIDALTSGTGTFLVDIEEAQLFWELGQTGLEKIQEIDTISLGWRTYATAAGLITRKQITASPYTEAYVWWFKEGVDILDGSTTVEIEDPKNEITVSGFDGNVTVSLDPADDPFDWNRNAYWIRFQHLRTQALSMGVINSQDIALYILSQISRHIIRITFTTYLDIHFQGQEVIKVTSPRLEVDQQFWVQSVEFNADGDGAWSQTITAISDLQIQNRRLITPPIEIPPGDPSNPVPGDEVTLPELPGPDGPTPPGPVDFLMDFTLEAIDQELAEPADSPGTGSAQYVVTASDTSTNAGTLLYNRRWQATGSGVTVPDTGMGPLVGTTFTTSFSSLDGAQITLTLQDGLGNEQSLTKDVTSGETPIRSRKLYALTPATYDAYNGTAWVQQPPVLPSKVQALGAGPLWGADHYVVVSTDDLATPPIEYAALPPGEDVLCIWLHETNNQLIAIGGANGSIGISTDGGATWTARTSLGEAVQGIIISIFRENELHVVTPSGWYTSDDQGESWRLVRGGDFLYLELSNTRNIVVTNAGALEVAETGEPFTRPDESSPIKAATAHIRQDKFYAIAEDGSTWWQEESGALAMVAGEPIPDLPTSQVLPGGAYRDGQMVDMVFFAAQDGGIFKTVDGFRTADGYLRLRNADTGLLTP